jgi:hypothetical protein
MEQQATASDPLPAVDAPRKKQPGIVFVLAALHVLALLLLYVGSRERGFASFEPHLCRVAWLGLICGQISLAAIFGALAPLPLLLRLSFGLIAAAVGWGLILLGVEAAIQYSGAWAAMAALQFMLVALGSFLLRICVRQAEGESARSLLGQYTIATLLAWTTLIAVLLGLLRWAAHSFGWNESILRWEWFFHVQLIGLFNAALALVALASVIGSRWPRLRRTWGLIIALVIVFHEPSLFDVLFRRVGADYGELWAIGGVQVFTLFSTLHLIRWAGGLAEQVTPLRQPGAAC